uniref:Uncharacterized protein n=1 Tax=Romanomermis culicivorax TaxID=13658 RepID=A0A915ILM0_ROMCU
MRTSVIPNNNDTEQGQQHQDNVTQNFTLNTAPLTRIHGRSIYELNKLQPIYPQAGTILGTHQMMINSGLHQQQMSAHNHTTSNGVTTLQNNIVPNINNVIQ